MKRPAVPSEVIEEETFMILHSGEIPEIAYYGAIHYLTEEPDGPRLSRLEIGEEGFRRLKSAVVSRYRTIIMRDLEPGNRDKRIYRGVQRAAVNWMRLRNFARKEALDIASIQKETADKLLSFLAQETQEVLAGARKTSINCTIADLFDFARNLGLYAYDLPKELGRLQEGS